MARVNEDATLTVITGIIDIGQGADIILRQVAAEELGIDVAHVHLVNGDTAVAPFDPGSTGLPMKILIPAVALLAIPMASPEKIEGEPSVEIYAYLDADVL